MHTNGNYLNIKHKKQTSGVFVKLTAFMNIITANIISAGTKNILVLNNA